MAKLLFLCLATAAAVQANSITVLSNTWEQFSFYQTGSAAQGCYPNDPDGLTCIASSTHNSTFLPSGPWTFSSSSPMMVTITDAFLYGESFMVLDNGNPVGTTPLVATGGGCGSDPAVCVLDSHASHGTFLLPSSPGGTHSFEIVPVSIDSAGSAYFKLGPAEAVPEPGAGALVLAGLGAVAFWRTRKRAAAAVVAMVCVTIAHAEAPDGSAAAANLLKDSVIADYEFPAAVDPSVLAGIATQISARVYRPAALNGVYPLVIFLQGNHKTCGRDFIEGVDAAAFKGARIDDSIEYTLRGTCSEVTFPGNRKVAYRQAPSHLGYEYVATRLAKLGYVVVSINANRGINMGPGVTGDPGLIRARARLILAHLVKLSLCNTKGNSGQKACDDLNKHLDFSNVGLVGHSRGGEAVRIAPSLYSAKGSGWPKAIADPVTFKAIFEIAPVDGPVTISLDGDQEFFNIPWSVLLPMCDGDVQTLDGVRPFDRMMRFFKENPPAQKSTYTVWGANHNFYNTQWQTSDAAPATCTGTGNDALFPAAIGSAKQRLTAISSVMAFIRGNVTNPNGASDPAFNQNFNPLYDIPANVTDEDNKPQPYPTRVDRGFTPSPKFMRVVDDFDKAAGTSSSGVPNDSSKITITNGAVPNHDSKLKAGRISWKAKGADVYFQANMTAANVKGIDVSGYKTLDLRVSRQRSAMNKDETTDFSIALVSPNGVMTKNVLLSTYISVPGKFPGLRGPVAGRGGSHPILQTVRIPLEKIPDYDKLKNNIMGVRLIFDQTNQGAINVSQIRFTEKIGVGVDLVAGTPQAGAAADPSELLALLPADEGADAGATPASMHSGSIASIRIVPFSTALEGNPGIEITLVSGEAFPGGNDIPILHVGANEFDLSMFTTPDARTIVFTVTPQEFLALSDGAPVSVHLGSTEIWRFGDLRKSMLH